MDHQRKGAPLSLLVGVGIGGGDDSMIVIVSYLLRNEHNPVSSD